MSLKKWWVFFSTVGLLLSFKRNCIHQDLPSWSLEGQSAIQWDTDIYGLSRTDTRLLRGFSTKHVVIELASDPSFSDSSPRMPL